MFDITPYQHCIYDVHPHMIERVINVESKGNPLAINVNGLKRKIIASNRNDAIKQVNYYIQHGYSVDIGLMQINNRNIQHYGVTLAQLFTPCVNINVGSHILYDAYQSALNKSAKPQIALRYALSLYNTGNIEHGFKNGYVGKYTHSLPFNKSLPIDTATTTINTDTLYKEN